MLNVVNVEKVTIVDGKAVGLWGAYNMDPNTNLPSIPRDAFWEVARPKDSSSDYAFLYLMMRETKTERKLFRTREVAVITEIASMPIKLIDMSAAKVLEQACYLLSTLPRGWARLDEIRAETERLYGKYPPQNLLSTSDTED